MSRMWQAFGLRRHRSGTFKLSRDRPLKEKIRDIVRVYVKPPDHAVVRCVDEKSEMEAPDGTAALLPRWPGQAERRTDEHRRHGTTSLFVAPEVKTGAVIAERHGRQRVVEFGEFVDGLDESAPAEIDVHLIMDNYGTHNRPLIRAWFGKRTRFQVWSSKALTIGVRNHNGCPFVRECQPLGFHPPSVRGNFRKCPELFAGEAGAPDRDVVGCQRRNARARQAVCRRGLLLGHHHGPEGQKRASW